MFEFGRDALLPLVSPSLSLFLPFSLPLCLFLFCSLSLFCDLKTAEWQGGRVAGLRTMTGTRMGIWRMGDDAVRCDVVFLLVLLLLLLLLLNAWLWDNVVFLFSFLYFLLHELWAFSQTKGEARLRARAMGDGVFL